MSEETLQLSKTEQHLIDCLKSFDSQIAREMQRSPSQLEKQGVQKWTPYQRHIERLSAVLISSLGEQQVDLDSLIVMSQAFAKTLRLVCEDLEDAGLGRLRAAYCKAAFEEILEDARRGKEVFEGVLTN